MCRIPQKDLCQEILSALTHFYFRLLLISILLVYNWKEKVKYTLFSKFFISCSDYILFPPLFVIAVRWLLKKRLKMRGLTDHLYFHWCTFSLAILFTFFTVFDTGLLHLDLIKYRIGLLFRRIDILLCYIFFTTIGYHNCFSTLITFQKVDKCFTQNCTLYNLYYNPAWYLLYCKNHF